MSRFIRSSKQFADPHDAFSPSFKIPFVNNDFVFPLLIDDRYLLSKQLATFESCLIFLLNFFYKSNIAVQLDDIFLSFLYNYLNYVGLLLVDKKIFLSYFKDFSGLTYADLFIFLLKTFGLLDSDCVFHRERIIVEYTAFKR